LADGALAGLIAGDAGLIEEGAAVLIVFEVAFVFEDADGGVREGRIGGQGVEDVLDPAGSAVPEDVHKPEFGFGEGGGFFAGHRNS